jgi:predicted Fe-S protein YdhL (DUF1289 family)
LSILKNDAYFQWAKGYIKNMTDDDKKSLTPCMGICDYNSTIDKCNTCYRTLAQITAWSGLTKTERRDIMRQIKMERTNAKQSKTIPE